MSRRDSYIKGASLLAGGMLIAKVIGAIYRIPLTNIIGAEGIGLYQLIFPIYALLITVTGSGIPITLSRVIAEKRIEKDFNEVKAMFISSAKIFMLIGLGASILLYLFSDMLSDLQGNPSLALGYRLIAPAILLSTGIATIRGWFQGNMNMLPSSVSQVVEQSVKLILGLVFASLLIGRGVEYAVWGAIGAITISEIFALLMLIGQYYYSNRKQEKFIMPAAHKRAEYRSFIKELMVVMLPITLGGLMIPLVQFVDSLLIVNLLRLGGITPDSATGMYGLLTGPVGSLINMPVVLTLAFAISAVPVVSSSRVKRDIASIKDKSRMSVKLTFAIGVPSSLALYALAHNVMNVLYPNLSQGEINLAAGLLQVVSVSIILLSIMQIYTALLQATDKAYTPFVNMTIGAIIKVILTIILVRLWGIYGAAISTIIAYLIVVILNVIALNRWTGKNEKLTQNISTILFSGVIMSLSIIFITSVIRTNNLLSLLIGTVTGIIVYGILLVLLKTFSYDELEGMPLSRVLIKATEIIRFWERSNDNSSRSW